MTNTFMADFFLANLVLAGIIGMLFLLQHMLRNHLSAKSRYRMWFFLFPACILPLLPVRLWNIRMFLEPFQHIPLLGQKSSELTASAGVSTSAASTDWLHDYAVDSGSGLFISFSRICFFLLLAGMLLMLIRTCFSMYHVYCLKKSSSAAEDTLEKVFQQYKGECGLAKPIPLRTSPSVSGPVTLGFFHPQIILPEDFVCSCKTEELRHVLLHELLHCKQKDMVINYLSGILRIVYWFHPLVHIALRKLSVQREIACDAAVLTVLTQAERTSYGYTLLRFANADYRKYTCTLSGIGGSKKQLKTRIQKIASFHTFNKKQRRMEGLCVLLSCCLLFSCLPFLSLSAASSKSSLPTPNPPVSQEDLSVYFQDFQGSFVLYDATNEDWSIYNEAESNTRVSPDSTYKIYSALFALENEIITPTQTEIAWNQNSYSFEAWNQDQTLSLAMKNSVNWYFQTLDKESGLSSLQAQFREIGYGNEDLSGGIDRYWMESSLLISPQEQVQLLNAFYHNAFSFSEENIQTVKDALYLSSFNGASLYGKTGTGMQNGQNANGWFIGFVEQADHLYFFAVNIHDGHDPSGSNAAKIALDVLKDKGICP